MSLLSDDDKALLVLEHLGPAALAGDTMSLYDCFQLALDVAEKAILAKLASAELPEPVVIDKHESGYEIRGYKKDQLRQAYAQGAASQLSAEPFIHYRHYDEQVQPFADEATIPLFTLKEPK
jgi:hypothetical protein